MRFLSALITLSFLAVIADAAERSASTADWIGRITRVIEWMDEVSIRLSGSRDHNIMRLRLFKPEVSESAKSLPLIVWLHGFGESGTDNTLQLRWLDLLFNSFDRPDQCQFFLCALQCPPEHPMWYLSPGIPRNSEGEPMTLLREVIEHLLQRYSIDEDRIYLVGVSSGGDACWEMAMRYPDLFAAVAPLGSPGGDSSRLPSLLDIPIWAFHTSHDPDTDVELVRQSVARLRHLGGKCALTEIEGKFHDCWTAAFEDYDLLEWLLAQKKGNANCPAPGDLSAKSYWKLACKNALGFTQWWPFAFLVSVVIAIAVLIRREFRRHQTSNEIEAA